MLPPLATQREIVEQLDALRRAAVAARRATVATDALRKAAIEELVVGIQRVPELAAA